MKKIVSKSDKEKKARKNQIIVGLILIGIMVLGTAGYSFRNGLSGDGNSGTIKYNGYDFIKQGGYWTTDFNGATFALLNNPKNLSDLEIDSNKTLEDYYQQPLYISYDDGVAATEIYNNLKPYVQRIQPACYENCEGGEVKKTCEDNFIIIRNSENSEVSQKENCVFIDGNEGNRTKLTDKFLLKVFGIDG